MLQLPNTVGGSLYVLAKGRLSYIPPSNPHTPLPVEFGSESASRVLKGEVILSSCSYGTYLLPSQSREEIREMQPLQEGTSNSFCALRGASPRTPTALTVKPVSSVGHETTIPLE